jgi:Zn-dependent protease
LKLPVVSAESIVIGAILLAGLIWALVPRQTYRIHRTVRVYPEDLFGECYFQRDKKSSSSLIESVEWDALPADAGYFTSAGQRNRFQQNVDHEHMKIKAICMPVSPDNQPIGDLFEVTTSVTAVEGGARYELVYDFRNQPGIGPKTWVARIMRPLILVQAPYLIDDALRNAGKFDRYDAIHGPKPAAPSFMGMPLTANSLALAAAAFAWFYWQDSLWGAIAVMLCILFHELGHLAAMRVFGDRDTRFYFIPFFGGVAMGQQKLAADWQLVVIVLAGPTVGLLSAAACWFLYQSTDNLWFFACANLFALVNLVNLLPIPILDGGQILNALLRPFVAMATRRWIASGLLALGVAGGLYIQSAVTVVLFTFFIVAQQMAGDKDPAQERRVLSVGEILVSLVASVAVVYALFVLLLSTYNEYDLSFAKVLAAGPL